MKKAGKVSVFFFRTLKVFFTDSGRVRRETGKGGDERKNILIRGGNFKNKGDQAMIFTAVDHLRRNFPQAAIFLLAAPGFDKEFDGNQYRFQALPWSNRLIFSLLGKKQESASRAPNGVPEKEVSDILRNGLCVLDLSGYSLSSQIGVAASVSYLLNILVARRYLIPYYIFPQSIGPFQYPFPFRFAMNRLLKIYLNYPEKIFVREKSSLPWLKKFRRDGCGFHSDIVLGSREYRLENIFREIPSFKSIPVESGSVGIIPSMKVFRRMRPDDFFSVYGLIIRILVESGKKVVLLPHTDPDRKICRRLAALPENRSRVRPILDSLNCIETERVIRSFEFIVASRYHAVIHAYKNGVPALVIGWAGKYAGLLEAFDQSEFSFDCREKIDREKMAEMLDALLRNHRGIGEKIKCAMTNLKEEDLFAAVAKDLESFRA